MPKEKPHAEERELQQKLEKLHNMRVETVQRWKLENPSGAASRTSRPWIMYFTHAMHMDTFGDTDVECVRSHLGHVVQRITYCLAAMQVASQVVHSFKMKIKNYLALAKSAAGAGGGGKGDAKMELPLTGQVAEEFGMAVRAYLIVHLLLQDFSGGTIVLKSKTLTHRMFVPYIPCKSTEEAGLKMIAVVDEMIRTLDAKIMKEKAMPRHNVIQGIIEHMIRDKQAELGGDAATRERFAMRMYADIACRLGDDVASLTCLYAQNAEVLDRYTTAARMHPTELFVLAMCDNGAIHARVTRACGARAMFMIVRDMEAEVKRNTENTYAHGTWHEIIDIKGSFAGYINAMIRKTMVDSLYAGPVSSRVARRAAAVNLHKGTRQCFGCHIPGIAHADDGKFRVMKDWDLQECGGCGLAYYCSRVCQKQHYRQHKPFCMAVKRDREPVGEDDATSKEEEMARLMEDAAEVNREAEQIAKEMSEKLGRPVNLLAAGGDAGKVLDILRSGLLAQVEQATEGEDPDNPEVKARKAYIKEEFEKLDAIRAEFDAGLGWCEDAK